MKSGMIAFHKCFCEFFIIMKRVSGVMVSVLVSSATNCGFEPSQIKDCCICIISAIFWREQATFQCDVDDIHFVLDQHT
jgi:hypothetical protein